MGTFFSSLENNKPIIHVMILKNQKDKPKGMYRALVDTGATISCISKSLAESLELTPIDKLEAITAGGKYESHVYKGVIIFPLNNQKILTSQGVMNSYNEKTGMIWKFAEARLEEQGLDLLMGMDLISQGNFYINESVFLFELPTPIVKEIPVFIPMDKDSEKEENSESLQF